MSGIVWHSLPFTQPSTFHPKRPRHWTGNTGSGPSRPANVWQGYAGEIWEISLKIATRCPKHERTHNHRYTGVCELERFANILSNVGSMLLLLALFQQLSRLFLMPAHLLLRFSTFASTILLRKNTRASVSPKQPGYRSPAPIQPHSRDQPGHARRSIPSSAPRMLFL